MGPLGDIERALLSFAKKEAAPTQHRTKISIDDFQRIVSTAAAKQFIRPGLISILAFRAALRISEVLHIRRADVTLNPTGEGQILIRKSKTDQTGQGTVIPFRLAADESDIFETFIIFF